MLVTLSSVRGSPGVTSWAVLLAAAWPAGERIIVEADCAGGVLGARYGLGVEPGALSLIAAARHRPIGPDPAEHGREVADGLWIVPGPESAETAVPVWRSGVDDVVRALADDDRLWLADIGRSGPDSPTRKLAESAALNLVVTRPAVEDLIPARSRVAMLAKAAPTAVMVVGRCRLGEDEVHRFLGGRALWIVPAVDDLHEIALRAAQGGRSRRSPAWRAALEVAGDIAGITARRRPASGPRRSPPPLPPPSTAIAEAQPAPEPPRPADRGSPIEPDPVPEPEQLHDASPAMRAATAHALRSTEAGHD